MLACVATASTAAAPYVSLGGGWLDKHHRYGWEVGAEREPKGTGPHAAQRPCISVASFRREGNQASVGASWFCYGKPGYLTAKAEPLIVTNPVFSNEKGSATAFGVAAAPAARKLQLTLANGRRTIRLHELNEIQARKVRLRPFRYAGFVLRGEWCIERVTILNESGNVLWDEGTSPCPPEEEARSRLLLGG